MYELTASLGEAIIRACGAFFAALLRPFAFLSRRCAALVRRLIDRIRSLAARSREPARSEPVRRPRSPSGGRKPVPAAHRTATQWFIPAAAAVLLLFTIVRFASSRAAIRIDAGDVLIGYAAAESDYLAARSAAEARIRCGGDSFEGGLPDVTYKVERIGVDGFTPRETMTDRLLRSATGPMTEACGVFVEGEFVGAVYSEAEARGVFDGILEQAQVASGGTASCFFAESVSYVPGLYPDCPDCIKSAGALTGAARELTLMASRTEITSEPVGYSVVEIPSRTLSVNTARTILEGENGVDQVTRVVTYADGKAVSSQEVSRITVVQPIAMRRLVGTKMYSLPVRQTFASVTQLLWPVDGAYNINSDYAYRWGKFHYGLDIGVGSAPGTSLGMNVLAAADGVVELATTHSSYGYYIILDHGNGMETVYGHLLEDSFKVRPGEAVKQGQPIARVGQTGYATGPHLHFEVRVNGNKVDPKLYLQQYRGIGY